MDLLKSSIEGSDAPDEALLSSAFTVDGQRALIISTFGSDPMSPVLFGSPTMWGDASVDDLSPKWSDCVESISSSTEKVLDNHSVSDNAHDIGHSTSAHERGHSKESTLQGCKEPELARPSRAFEPVRSQSGGQVKGVKDMTQIEELIRSADLEDPRFLITIRQALIQQFECIRDARGETVRYRELWQKSEARLSNIQVQLDQQLTSMKEAKVQSKGQAVYISQLERMQEEFGRELEEERRVGDRPSQERLAILERAASVKESTLIDLSKKAEQFEKLWENSDRDLEDLRIKLDAANLQAESQQERAVLAEKASHDAENKLTQLVKLHAEQMDALIAEHYVSLSQLQTRVDQFEVMRENVVKASERQKEIHEDLLERESELQHCQATCFDIEKQRDSLQKQLENRESRYTQLESEVEKSDARSRFTISTLEDELRRKEEETNVNKGQLKSAEHKLLEIERDVVNERKQRQKAQDSVSRLTEELYKTNKQHKEEAEAMEDQISQLQDDLNTAIELRDENEMLVDRCKDLADDRDKSTDRCRALESELESTLEDLRKAQGCAEWSQEQSWEKERHIGELRDDVGEKERLLGELTDQLNYLRGEHQSTKEKLRSVEKELSTAIDSSNQLSNAVAAAEKQAESHFLVVKQMEDERLNLMSQVREGSRKVDDYVSQLTEVEGERDRAFSELNEVKLELDEVTRQQEATTEQMSEMMRERDRTEGELNEARRKAEMSVEEHNAFVDQMTTERENLQYKLNEAVDELTAIRQEKQQVDEEMRKVHQKTESERRDLLADVERVNAELNRVNAERGQMRVEVDKLRHENGGLNTKLQDKLTLLEQRDAKCGRLAHEIGRLNGEVDDARFEMRTLEEKNQHLTRKMAEERSAATVDKLGLADKLAEAQRAVDAAEQKAHSDVKEAREITAATLRKQFEKSEATIILEFENELAHLKAAHHAELERVNKEKFDLKGQVVALQEAHSMDKPSDVEASRVVELERQVKQVSQKRMEEVRHLRLDCRKLQKIARQYETEVKLLRMGQDRVVCTAPGASMGDACRPSSSSSPKLVEGMQRQTNNQGESAKPLSHNQPTFSKSHLDESVDSAASMVSDWAVGVMVVQHEMDKMWEECSRKLRKAHMQHKRRLTKKLLDRRQGDELKEHSLNSEVTPKGEDRAAIGVESGQREPVSKVTYTHKDKELPDEPVWMEYFTEHLRELSTRLERRIDEAVTGALTPSRVRGFSPDGDIGGSPLGENFENDEMGSGWEDDCLSDEDDQGASLSLSPTGSNDPPDGYRDTPLPMRRVAHHDTHSNETGVLSPCSWSVNELHFPNQDQPGEMETELRAVDGLQVDQSSQRESGNYDGGGFRATPNTLSAITADSNVGDGASPQPSGYSPRTNSSTHHQMKETWSGKTRDSRCYVSSAPTAPLEFPPPDFRGLPGQVDREELSPVSFSAQGSARRRNENMNNRSGSVENSTGSTALLCSSAANESPYAFPQPSFR
eukprot:GHVN01034754.1.p1 GENE.GHVN01034754.1~~GHVN01034754.1.p1  ORF type:complete len:1490 (-),score=311.06 GHVN01034754.1:2871-7340(-)